MADPVFRGRQSHEAKFIRDVISEHTTAVIPWQVQAPVGHAVLKRLVADESQPKEMVA